MPWKEEGCRVRIYLATWLEDNQGVSLTKANARRRLISYYFVSTQGKNLT